MVGAARSLRIGNDRISGGKIFTYVEASTETLTSILALTAIPRAIDASIEAAFRGDGNFSLAKRLSRPLCRLPPLSCLPVSAFPVGWFRGLDYKDTPCALF
jgi:hypothetical protein